MSITTSSPLTTKAPDMIEIEAVDAKTATKDLIQQNGPGVYRLMHVDPHTNQSMVTTTLSYRKGGGRIHIEQFPPEVLEPDAQGVVKGGNLFVRIPNMPYVLPNPYTVYHYYRDNKEKKHEHTFKNIRVDRALENGEKSVKEFKKLIESTVKDCLESLNDNEKKDKEALHKSVKIMKIIGYDGDDVDDVDDILNNLFENSSTSSSRSSPNSRKTIQDLTFHVKLVYVKKVVQKPHYGTHPYFVRIPGYADENEHGTYDDLEDLINEKLRSS